MSRDRKPTALVMAMWIAGCLGFSSGIQAEEAPATTESSITVKELTDHVTFLASDVLQGREAGTEGGYASATYIVQELKKNGVKPLIGRQDYYQYVSPNFRNIVAAIPGSDDSLSGEYILIGAHYDHVGFGTPRNSRGPIGYVHNGADDNASGTAGLLEVAESLVTADPPPRRSILIVFWDGEEKGLIGSKYFVDFPLVPMGQIRASLNADMIGRLRPVGLQVFGWRTATGFRRLLASQNTDKLKIDFTYEYKADSDHWPFFQSGIPSVMFHTGKHDQYHRPDDDIDTLNIEGIQQSARYILRTALALSRADHLPEFRTQSRNETSPRETLFKKAEEFANRPSRLGVNYEPPENADSKDVIRISSVERDSPAAKAGLQAGDEIVEFAGRSTSEVPDFRTLVLAVVSPARTTIRRDGATQEFSIELRGAPSTFGFSWWVDRADPGAIVVTGVLPGSPAEIAGLKPEHRILSVFGQPADDSESFKKLLLDHQHRQVPIEVEYEGQFTTIELERLELPAPANAE